MKKNIEDQGFFFESDSDAIMKELGKDALVLLKQMLFIRNFELRAEASYLQGKVGGFFHSYVGQEAVQTACVKAIGLNNWFITSYRCHALALLTGASGKEVMAEFFGKSTGNAKGRGGSMHLFTDRLLGGFGIVCGQMPITIGAGFSLKYQGIKDQVAIGFLGDGAVAQGAFHESLNLASLWNLPCIIVIENNQWGMGTNVDRAISVDRIAEHFAKNYEISGYTLDGTDILNCYAGFKHAFEEVLKTKRPVLIEAITERFKGHSISDPALYRTKEDLKKIMESKDPIHIMKARLIEKEMLSEDLFKKMDKEQKEIVMDAIKFADESPWPDITTLEEDVFGE